MKLLTILSMLLFSILSLSQPSLAKDSTSYYVEAAPLKVIWGSAALKLTSSSRDNIGYTFEFEHSSSDSALSGYSDSRSKTSVGLTYNPLENNYFVSMAFGIKKESVGHQKTGKYFGDFDLDSDEILDKWITDSTYLTLTPAIGYRVVVKDGFTGSIDLSMDSNIYSKTNKTIRQNNSNEILEDDQNMSGANPLPSIRIYLGLKL